MSETNTIVLTGFEPFGGGSYNPSQQIAQRLAGSQIAGFDIKGFVLPVDTNTAPTRLAQIIEEERPVAVVSLGLASGRNGISVERIAANMKDWTLKDNSGNLKTDEPIDPAGPAAYFATLPVRQIKLALDAAEIPAYISNSAGLYLCNQIMYCGLHLAATQQLKLLSGFIHLPATPEMTVRAGKPETPSMSLDLQIRAVQIALQTVAASLTAS